MITLVNFSNKVNLQIFRVFFSWDCIPTAYCIIICVIQRYEIGIVHLKFLSQRQKILWTFNSQNIEVKILHLVTWDWETEQLHLSEQWTYGILIYILLSFVTNRSKKIWHKAFGPESVKSLSVTKTPFQM